ncbi:MAG: tRNA lysidine(34) synthetase TilS [Acidobacteria bacterium]|nr:tRNA lysidine(34) synthetase TilS [Acidobacteriota bacterium]
MSEVRARIRRFLDELNPPVRRLIVAFSGGGDSTALLTHLAGESGSGIDLLAVHINHRLRGAESDEDEAWACAYAADLGVDFESVVAEPDPEVIRRSGVEAAARTARYAALEDVRARLRFDYIATAHVLEDQAETVLMKLLDRGNIFSLRGIRSRRGRLIRPVLDMPRSALVDLHSSSGVTARRDRMNFDRRFLRPRVRHEILPLLREQSESIDEQLSAVANAVDALFESSRSAIAEVSVVWHRAESSSTIPISALPDEPWLLHEVLARELRRFRPKGRNISLSRLERELGRGGKVSVGEGIDAILRAGELTLVDTAVTVAPWSYPVVIGEPRAVPDIAATVTVELAPGDHTEATTNDQRTTQLLGLETAGGEIELRNRRPGDRFQPLGMTGHRKLKDVLIDRRVPRSERDRIPLLVIDGVVAWIPGVEVSERFRVEEGRDLLRVSIDYDRAQTERD